MAAVLSASIAPAYAAESSLDIYDAESVITAIAPEISLDGVTLDSVNLDVRQSESSVDISFGATVEQRESKRGDVPDEIAPVISPDLSFTASYFDAQRGQIGEISVWATDSPSVAAYVQPLSAGVRVMTAIADDSAPTRYGYDLDVPAGSYLRQNDLGNTLWAPDGTFLGQLHTPWARDAAGLELPTHYEWNEGTLTQVVDLDAAGITFPVLVDPAWTYGYMYDIALKSVSQTRSMLHTCFNCYFPVEGAPASFPTTSEYLPLIVRPWAGSPIQWDFSCYFNLEQVTVHSGYTYFNFSFQASTTHVDGDGSWISFDFSPRDPSQPPAYAGTRLVVNAYIVNDDPVGLGRPAYEFAASQNWGVFANNIETG